jgi:hypothetical protein
MGEQFREGLKADDIVKTNASIREEHGPGVRSSDRASCVCMR